MQKEDTVEWKYSLLHDAPRRVTPDSGKSLGRSDLANALPLRVKRTPECCEIAATGPRQPLLWGSQLSQSAAEKYKAFFSQQ
jgi:hypothetical protein